MLPHTRRWFVYSWEGPSSRGARFFVILGDVDVMVTLN